MQLTGNDLIQRALRRIGRLAEGETMTSQAAEDARIELNEILDQWQADRIRVFTEISTQHTLASGTATYTIGTGATWNQTRPTEILRALVVPNTGSSPQLEIPVQLMSPQRWANRRLKTTSGAWPFAIYYDRTMNASGYGTVHVYPVPQNASSAIILWTKEQLSQFADLTTQYQFPPGYAKALRLSLAVALAPEYGVQPPPVLLAQTDEAVAVLERTNHVRDEMVIDRGLATVGGGHYNVYTDEG